MTEYIGETPVDVIDRIVGGYREPTRQPTRQPTRLPFDEEPQPAHDDVGDDLVGDELPPPTQPMAVADRLVEQRYQHDGSLVLRHWRGGWWRWSTSHWSEVEYRDVRREAYRFTEKALFLKPEKD